MRRRRGRSSNIHKRLVKSPKVYWRDSGLLHAILNIQDLDPLLRQPWVGASWEGFVIEQILGFLGAQDVQVRPYHFRTHDGYELDLVLDFGHTLWSMEIKLTSAPGRSELSRLEKTSDLIQADRRFLLSRSPEIIKAERTTLCDLRHFLGLLSGMGA